MTHLPLDNATAFLRSFGATLWLQKSLKGREAVNRHHLQHLEALTSHARGAFPFYAQAESEPFDNWPILDKQRLLDHFDQLNLARLSARDVREALAGGEQHLKGHCIGQSTGTSGNRGYYVISDRERFVWLGAIVAKTLPDALWRRHRVALALPNMPALYQSASQSSRIALRFFDLALGIESWAEDLVHFAPDTIVAPPKVLRWLADHGRLPDALLFSAAEVLDPLDRAAIEGASGRPLREIYMATEGLLGVSCRHGTLHLAEDVIHYEWEAVAPGSALLTPIVTDFRRRGQAMIRYRMNDLLELEEMPCPCGSAFQAVRRIVGRRDDCLDFTDSAGLSRLVTPDVLRNAVVDAHDAISDFRVVQTAPDTIAIFLPDPTAPEVCEAVRARVAAALAVLGVAPRIKVGLGIDTPFDRKLRRVLRA